MTVRSDAARNASAWRRQNRPGRSRSSVSETSARDELFMDLEEQKDNRTNMEILHNTISKAAEASQIADGTLVQLATQRQQLLRIDDDLFTINKTLAQCEKRIKGLNTNMFTALFHNSSKVSKEADTRYKGAPSTTTQPDSKVPSASASSSEAPIFLPPHVRDRAACAADKSLAQFIDANKANFEWGKDEKVMFHYCNTRQPLVKDQYSKSILLTNQRLLRVVDGSLASKIYLPDVVSVVHRPTKPLQYDVLVFRFVSGFEDTVDIWNADVAEFFTSMVDLTVRELASRRKTRTDGDLEARAKRMGMSDLEVQFERDKVEEDKQLDVLGHIVDGLHERAKAMGDELGVQKGIIDHLDDRVDATDDRLKKSQKGLDRLLGQTTTPSLLKK